MKVKNFVKRAINNWAVPRFRNILPLWCIPKRNERFKAYCVGNWKTGTTSIHTAFSQHYRSAHEPEAGFLCNRILAYATGKIDKDELTRFVKRRDRWLGLEMDSSGWNYLLLDVLVSEFSEAKFILTIRDCYSWLESYLDHSYRNYRYLQAKNINFRKKTAMKIHQLLFAEGDLVKHAPEEQILADSGLYALDDYFKLWAEQINHVLNIVPKERLLIVKTKEINQDIPKIETFLGLTPGTLLTKARENVRREKQKQNFLSKIDKDFLEEKANFHCKELMDKYFPEVKGYSNPVQNATESN